MSSDDTASLIYLGLLGAAVAAYFFTAHRQNLSQMVRHGMLWALILIGLVAGYGLWSDIRREILPSQAVFETNGSIEVPRSTDGHYYLVLQANGKNLNFVVDTGATDIVLTQQDARRVGIDPEDLVYSGVANTANGQVRTARAKVETLELGPIVDRNVTVWVNDGEMAGSLLGMAYLQRFDRIEISGNRLVLER